jgi:hypothetical protein
MNRKIVWITVVMVVLLSLTGCGSGAGGPGPRTWIDAPLDGSTVDPGAVVVRSHAASDAGIAQAVLLVNGELVRTDAPADPAAALVEIVQTWTVDGPGDYMLQVITTDQAGNEGRSNLVRVRVGGAPAEGTPTPSSTPDPAVTATATTLSDPAFTFDTNANCRAGDSTAYGVVTSFLQGAQARIEGRNADGSWFLVQMPAGGTCWVAGSVGTPSGPYGSVGVVVPPPLPPTDTPVPAQPPSAPGNLHLGGEVCTSEEFSVTLEWGDVAGEDGYRVYRDGQLIATLGEGETSYTDSPPDYNAHGYGVEAFNESGASNRPTVQEDGCLF